MANTYTVTDETVMGSWRVQKGTLTMTDGAAGSAVDTGMDRIISAPDTQSGHISYSGGDIIATTASSGDAFDVIVFGV